MLAESIYDDYGNAHDSSSQSDPFGYNARWGYYAGSAPQGHTLRDFATTTAGAGKWLTRDPIGIARRSEYLRILLRESSFTSADPYGEDSYNRTILSIGLGTLGGVFLGPLGAIGGSALGSFLGSLLDGDNACEALTNGVVDGAMGAIGEGLGGFVSGVLRPAAEGAAGAESAVANGIWGADLMYQGLSS